jgi:NTE family protein
MTQNAVVLAGGGLAGIAWEIGFLTGLQQEMPRLVDRILAESTTLVGTSAGAAVAAQLASGAPLGELFDAQCSPDSAEISAEIDLAAFSTMMSSALAGAATPEESRQRLGRMARAALTPPSADRREVIAARLPDHEWSARRVLLTAVDTDTGELRVFDRDSGVSLVDAVAASCAVPGIWPTVEIDGRHYMDGGMRSVSNADLAAGAQQVLILIPAPETGVAGETLAPTERAALAPARIHAVFADAESLAAFGTNPLDPAVRLPAARAGYEQGRRSAVEIAEFWR